MDKTIESFGLHDHQCCTLYNPGFELDGDNLDSDHDDDFFAKVGKSTLSELKETFGQDRVAFIRSWSWSIVVMMIRIISMMIITVITNRLVVFLYVLIIFILIAIPSCNVTKRDDLVALYEGCENHFGAKVMSNYFDPENHHSFTDSHHRDFYPH